MKNKTCHLFIIKNLLGSREVQKLQNFFSKLLDPHDFGYLANITIGDRDTFIACFEIDKIKIMEKVFEENGVLIKSEDITERTINLDFCPEVISIMNDHKDNREIIERFIISNLDLDKVLDKICDVGMDGISKIEKKFLLSF
jgi:hypothetical protein